MKIALLLTGNELMSGDTIDSNSSVIAKALVDYGFDVYCKSTVGDEFELLCEEIERLWSRYPVVIINGGLGPTTDDLTAQAMAEVAGVELAEHAEAKAQVSAWCERRGIKLSPANMKQAILPLGAVVLQNPVGSAPGIALQIEKRSLIATPGVPGELKAMLERTIPDYLTQTYPEQKGRLVRRLKTFGMGESAVQEVVSRQANLWPERVTLGFRAGLPLLELKLEVEDESDLEQRDQAEALIREWLGDAVVGEDDDELAVMVVSRLMESGSKLAVAESCTGGQIAASLTSVPDASRVFDGGVVSYANEVKIKTLGVAQETINRHGVVSEAVVREMAAGVLREVGGTHAVAVSGIAGPEGGTEAKPVGTVCIAWGVPDDLQSIEFCFPYGRAMFQQYVSAIALDLIRRTLLGNNEPPRFLRAGGRFASRSSQNSA